MKIANLKRGKMAYKPSVWLQDGTVHQRIDSVLITGPARGGFKAMSGGKQLQLSSGQLRREYYDSREQAEAVVRAWSGQYAFEKGELQARGLWDKVKRGDVAQAREVISHLRSKKGGRRHVFN